MVFFDPYAAGIDARNECAFPSKPRGHPPSKGKKKKRENQLTLLALAIDLLTAIVSLAAVLIDKLTD